MIAKETGASMITRRRRGLGNFSTNLAKEKILILNMLDVNLVNLGGSSVPNCYICRKDDHYANQCPKKDKGKAPTVNMVVPEIQQVIARSKGKQSKWEVLGNMSLRMEPDGTGCKMQRTGSLQNRPRSVPNRSEGQKCKYAEKSYKYKYGLGHRLFNNVVVVLL